MDTVVEARGLSKTYNGREVVCGIDLQVPVGGCFGLLGPNGAGKTTTLRMILGLSPPSGGTLQVLGLDMPGHAREVRAQVGVVPQQDNLDPDFTVAENLRVYARYFGLHGRQIEARIDDLLELVELDERAGSRIPALSGGMKRRLSIARSLINDPVLLVLDEPTTGLDPQVRHMIWTRLRRLKQTGKTLLLTTHYMEEAERLCDELVIMDHGRIIAQGSPQALVREHVEPEVIEIHGDQADTSQLRLDGARIELVGEGIYCYTHDAEPLIRELEQLPRLRFMHRPADLEDVFLKLTGRELRE